MKTAVILKLKEKIFDISLMYCIVFGRVCGIQVETRGDTINS